MNAENVRVFHLEPCADGFACETAIFHPPFALNDGTTMSTTHFADVPGHGAVLAYSLNNSAESLAIFANEAGWAIAGMRVPFVLEEYFCDPDVVAIQGERFAFQVRDAFADDMAGDNHHMGLAYAEAADPTTLIGRELPAPVPQGVGPQYWNALGSGAWIWQFGPTSRLVGVSLATGDWTLLAEYDAPFGGKTIEANLPVWAGDKFLFWHSQVDEATGDELNTIDWTDGVSAPEPYFLPPAGRFDMLPIVAGDYLAWLRGDGTFWGTHSNIELWASPLRSDGDDLEPQKIVDVAGISLDAGAGEGIVMLPGPTPGKQFEAFTLVDLEARQSEVRPLPDGKRVYKFTGISESSVWIVAIDFPAFTESVLKFPR